ncbi:patatin-like phospholipase family protein [Polaribacter sp. PL03]|uniref:patatin-like phospholipase family protein n=1 Tax=Polaribacter sp. PL03 TaxID=3088353 RepID=UPI0029CEEC9E|nr:patatin-like phospholipase family protein [Polaribacter sp. PL03]MDX6745724.1 patatin-like phospholipase family protein [Polaribacter sp. PL03]
MKLKLFFLFFILSISVFSQKRQPKVGVVLSGGGAKGFAHIGVLKALDEAGVQIDYIGGTSMGAIIGGLYAAGYSANQIEEIIFTTDFLTLIRDRLPRNSETFFEKEYGEKTVITLPVNKGKIGFPRAISKGQNVLNLLLELFDSVDGNQDFSKLSTPFFCIATDVENGAPVILESGSLPIALRASASFPSLLNPVEINNKLLVDGGIANNFPVSVMKDKGMDIVIGVDVEGKLFQKEKINSVVALLNQIMSYQMYSKTDEEIKKLDVYIHPEIFNYTVVDFDKKNEILEKGTIEAKKYVKVFEEIAAKQTVKKKRGTLEFSTEKLEISHIGIQGASNYTRAFVLGKLNIKEGDSLSRNDITKKIYLLSATRNYNRIEYNLIKKTNGSYLLDFKLKESNENANLKLGVHYDLLYKSSVLATYNQKHVFKNNDMFSFDMVLGDNLRYNLNYFVDNGFYISYGFRSRYNHFRSNAKFNQVSNISNVNSINLSYSDLTNQAFFQTTFNRKFALGLGLEHKWIKASTETLATATTNLETIIDRSNYFSAFGYLKLDTYNKKYFATKGYFADLNFKWYAASTDYNNDFRMFSQAKGTIGFATTFGDRFTLQNTNEAAFTIGNPTSNVFDFYLGGYNQNYINNFISLYGYEFSDLSNNSFIKTELNLRYRVGDTHYFSFIANYARLEDNVFKDLELFDNIKSGYALGYSYDSFIGPIELKYSWTPENKDGFWLFNLGFWF